MTAHGTIFHNGIGKRPPIGEVRQDKAGHESADTKLTDVGPVTTMRRSGIQTTVANIFCQQTRKQNVSERRQKMGFWLKPSTAAEIRRRAEQTGLSASATGANLLDEIVMQNLQIQHAALLQPMVEQAIRKQMNRLVTFLVSLLIPMYCNTGQTKRLVVNIIGRLHDNPQMSEQVLNTILDESSQAARNDLKRRSPHLASLIQEEIDRLLSEDETA